VTFTRPGEDKWPTRALPGWAVMADTGAKMDPKVRHELHHAPPWRACMCHTCVLSTSAKSWTAHTCPQRQQHAAQRCHSLSHADLTRDHQLDVIRVLRLCQKARPPRGACVQLCVRTTALTCWPPHNNRIVTTPNTPPQVAHGVYPSPAPCDAQEAKKQEKLRQAAEKKAKKEAEKAEKEAKKAAAKVRVVDVCVCVCVLMGGWVGGLADQRSLASRSECSPHTLLCVWL
jgi:hypothetical protein